MIEVDALTKYYGPTLAVDRLSFAVPEGTVCGFLGPNGAGKSTTLRILTGFMPPTAGRAAIAGHDVITASEQLRRQVGYLPESNPLYPEMRVEEYLHFRGRLMGMPRADRLRRINEVCDRTGLAHQRRRVIGALSKGNRQRVGLAQALLHDPRVLILDEPTSGLDPTQIGAFRKLLADLRERHTILVSTHILPEVEKTADRVIIIAAGRIVADGSPEQLRQRAIASSRLVLEVQGTPEQCGPLLDTLRNLANVQGVEAQTLTDQAPTKHTTADAEPAPWTRIHLTPKPGTDPREPVANALRDQRATVREMRSETASLDELFIQVTAPTATPTPPTTPNTSEAA